MSVPNLSINVLTSPCDVSSFWEWLTKPERKFIAADTETTGLDVYEKGFKVRLIQFGDSEGGWAIPFQEWRGLVSGVFDWASKQRLEIDWWNFNYDSGALEQEGLKLDYSIMSDGYVLAGLGGHCDLSRELKVNGVKELGPWANAGQSVLKDGMKAQGWNWANVPIGWHPYPIYGVLDTCLTAMLRDRWQDRYDRWRHMHDLEIATIENCNRMVSKGLAVDIPYLQQSFDSYLAIEQDIEVKIAKSYGGITPGQNDKIAAILKEEGYYPDDAPLTPTGGPSLTAAVLKRIDHKLARAVLRHRAVHKTRTAYLGKLIEHADSDARVHCDIQPMQARTSRMSISRPALQQLPSDDTPVDNVAVRRAIISHNPGVEDVATLDFSQIELREWASIMGDTALVTEIQTADKTGLDFFTSLCRSIYKEPDFQKKDHRRTQIKSSVYAKLFGGGIEIAANTAGVQVKDMIPSWKLLGERFESMAKAGMMAVVKDAQGAHAMSPFDRRFSVSADKEVRKLPNYLVQGTAAIALKKAIVGLVAAGLGEYLVLPVHDEVVSSVPKAVIDDVMAEMKIVMDSVITTKNGWLLDVPASGGHGATWEEAK